MSGMRPEMSQPCHSTYGCRWQPFDWTPCSNSCGTGTQSRKLSCANGDQSECDHRGGAPRVNRTCHDTSGCWWKFSDWSPCSSTCGEGTQRRNVTCGNGDLKDCLERAAMPPTQQSCRAFNGCRWQTGAWSECMAQCGAGVRHRYVRCANGELSGCQELPGETPAETKPCINVSGCVWSTGPWGPCTNVCGLGSQYRNVFCSNGKDSDCLQIKEPPDMRTDCSDMLGCDGMQSAAETRVEKCNCPVADPALFLAGLVNAACGWALGFCVVHEMASRVVQAGNLAPLTAVLMAPPALLMAGIGALGATWVLQSPSILNVPAPQHASVAGGSQPAVGFTLMVLWACSFCCTARNAWKASWRMRWTSSALLLGLALLVIFTAPPSPLLQKHSAQLRALTIEM